MNTRDEIRSGDLLVWSSPVDGKGGIWLKIVRFFTVSDFGHVSVALREGNDLKHIEAVIPHIRVVSVPKNSEFYVLPMSQVIGENPDMGFFDDKIGDRYSLYDAVRAYFGISTRFDDRWQCAELTEAFYQSHGIDIDLKYLTPSRLVKKLMGKVGIGLFRIKK